MNEPFLSQKTIIDEVVGIIGMLNNREGSTLKDITSILESLHGPMKPQKIQKALSLGVSEGKFICNSRRYKVCQLLNIPEQNSSFSLGRSSNDRTEAVSDKDLEDDDLSCSSSTSVCYNRDSEVEASEFFADDYSIQSSEQQSVHSYLSDVSSEESLIDSKPKQRRRKSKKRLLVLYPPKTNVGVQNDSFVENSPEKDFEEETIQEIKKEEIENKEILVSNTEANKSVSEDVFEKKTMNDVMKEIMKQISESKESNDATVSGLKDEHEVEGNEKNYENQSSNETMKKVMTQVMEKMHDFEESGSIEVPENETSRKKVPKGGWETTCTSGLISKIINRITGSDNKSSCDDNIQVSTENPNITLSSKRMCTDLLDVSSSCSNDEFRKKHKREKRVEQQNGSNNSENGCRYLTRSRVKSNQLKRSRLQSPNSDIPSKRSRYSEDDKKSDNFDNMHQSTTQK